MRILHLSADFPDPLAPGKTRAVANLLALAPDHDHLVYSLNRVTGPGGIFAQSFGPGNRAVAYAAPPLGVMLATRMAAVADWIASDLRGRGFAPDLVHAHKLSVEALAGHRLAAGLDVPLVVSSQGNSDLRILRARPDLRRRWRRIWRDAAAVLPFAPWTARALEQMLGPRSGPVQCLPCPTAADTIIPPRMAPPRLLGVFGLDEMANKRAGYLIDAVRIVRAGGLPAELEIVGTGSPASFARLSQKIRGLPFVRLAGHVRHDRIQHLMNRAALLAVPSRRESYGMVFAEALLAGCPVIHGAGNGPSGYFPRAPYAVPAPKRDAGALARTIARMLQGQAPIKAALGAAQRQGTLDFMRRPAIAGLYAQALAGARPGMAPVAAEEAA